MVQCVYTVYVYYIICILPRTNVLLFFAPVAAAETNSNCESPEQWQYQQALGWPICELCLCEAKQMRSPIKCLMMIWYERQDERSTFQNHDVFGESPWDQMTRIVYPSQLSKILLDQPPPLKCFFQIRARNMWLPQPSIHYRVPSLGSSFWTSFASLGLGKFTKMLMIQICSKLSETFFSFVDSELKAGQLASRLALSPPSRWQNTCLCDPSTQLPYSRPKNQGKWVTNLHLKRYKKMQTQRCKRLSTWTGSATSKGSGSCLQDQIKRDSWFHFHKGNLTSLLLQGVRTGGLMAIVK